MTHILTVNRIKDETCPHCLEWGFHRKMGPKFVMLGQVREPDWENWLQCYQCGNVYPVYEVKAQEKLKLDTQRHKQDNPFEAKNSFVTGIPKRSSKAGKRALERKRRERHR